ncbi:MAG: FAD:protein FMN transferase [Spirochaetia bacterium]|jgi:thiamine biosynthesis lipoprotein|nr:FAD:protein FMN transferase [Spirochaetia bacterium]
MKHKLFLLFPCCLLLFACNKQTTVPMVAKSGIYMGTVCAVSLPKGSDENLYLGAFDLLQDIDDNLSRTKEGSLVKTLNDTGKIKVADTSYFDLFCRAFELADATGGAFDPAIGKAVALWGIGTEHERIPSEAELAQVDADYSQVSINKAEHTITIPKGMEIDLGAIGKGYATDCLVSYFKEKGVGRAIINLGGNVRVIGSKAKDKPWKIGLQAPFKERGESYVLLSLDDVAVVTSGAYERYFVKDGKVYCHILDPKTLYPAETDIASSTIIGKDATLCDVLSTTCFVLGSSKALALLKKFPQVAAIFLLNDGSITTTPSFPYVYEDVRRN